MLYKNVLAFGAVVIFSLSISQNVQADLSTNNPDAYHQHCIWPEHEKICDQQYNQGSPEHHGCFNHYEVSMSECNGGGGSSSSAPSTSGARSTGQN